MNSKDLHIGIYKHLTNYFKERGVGIISDKQFAFYTQTNVEDGYTHETAILELDHRMYPETPKKETYKGFQNVVILTMDKLITIDLPATGFLTKNQLEILNYFLDEIKRYTKMKSSKKLIFVVCGTHKKDYLETISIEEVKRHLKNIKIDKPLNKGKETIIGKEITIIRREQNKEENKYTPKEELQPYYTKLYQYLGDLRLNIDSIEQEEIAKICQMKVDNLIKKINTKEDLEFFIENFLNLLDKSSYEESLIEHQTKLLLKKKKLDN